MSRPTPFSIATVAAGLVAVISGAARADAPAADHRFFARLSTGATYLRESWSPSNGSPGAVFTGAGPSLELSIGKSVRPRLIVGGRWQLTNVYEPNESYLGTTTVAPATDRFLDVVAAFADYTPNPRRGLHVGGSAGLLAASTIDRECCVTTHWGAALSARVGYDVFFSGRWSMSALAELEAYRYASNEANVSAASYGLLPTLALAVTFDWGSRRLP